MLTLAETTMRSVCAEPDVESLEFNGEPDHVHLLVATRPPRRSPISPATSNAVPLTPSGMRGHLWSLSYFAVSCGGAPLSIIKQYCLRPNPTTSNAGLLPAKNGTG